MKKIILASVCILCLVSTFSQVVYTNNFTSGSAGWTLGAGGNFDTWIVNNIYNCSDVTPNQGGGNYLHIYDDLFGEMCAYSGFLGSGSGGTVYATQTADFNTTGYTSVTVSFDWLCQGQTGPVLPSYGFIQYSTNGGSGWTTITSPISQYNGQSTWTNMSFSNTGMANQATCRIRFGFTNSGYGTNPAFAVDNITITGVTGTPCTNVGGTSLATPSTICSGNTSVLTVGGSTGSIQWEQSPDGLSWGNVVGGTGATTPSYTTPALSSTTHYRARLSQASCSDVYSTVSIVTVNPNVAASISIGASPSGPICEGTDVTFTATPTNGGTPSYQWYVGATPVGSGNTYNSSVLSNGDQVSCVMTSTASCVTGSPATSNTITMTVNPNPVVTISPPGPIDFCQDSSVILTAAPVGDYFWNNGATTQSINTANSGNHCVTVTDGNGCFNTACVMVTVHALPTVTISGDTTICQGDNSILTASGANDYVWSTAQIINPITVNPGTSATYTVTGTETVNGCSATATVFINVTPDNIDGSLSSVSSTTLMSNQGSAAYQWIDCDNSNLPIGGATNQSYTATSNGNYAVIITMGSCSDTSACTLINGIGIEDQNDIVPIQVYPNPSSGTFMIASTIAGNYFLVNELGQSIRSIQLNADNNYSVKVEEMKSGIYFIRGENSTVKEKIIVTR
jgi:hypothetical protein